MGGAARELESPLEAGHASGATIGVRSASWTKRCRLRLAVLVVLLVVIAWNRRWLQDDAYITFIYSRNLASGLGPVWHPGYVVEGYTNFLWMLLLAGGHFIGLEAPLASQVFSIACFAASLVLVFHLGRAVFRHDGWALLAVALVGTNYSFLKYSTGGLETELNAALTLGTLLIAVRVADAAKVTLAQAVGASTLVVLAIMTRPDSVLLGAVACTCLAVYAVKQRATAGQRTQLALGLVVPPLLILVPWLVWKHGFYGHLLPNTALVKLGVHRQKTMFRGIVYVAWPFISYGWIVVLAVLGFRLRGRRKRPPARVIPLLAYAALWFAYAIQIGGDIMEFRQLICVFPLVILLIVAGLRAAFTSRGATVGWVAFLLAGSVAHAFLFPIYERPRGIGNIPELSAYSKWWCALGTTLRDDLGEGSGVTIAVSPAGAIPYCSGLRAIDVLGLNDLWVAREGYVRRDCDVCLGHLRMATIDYLEKANANLVFGHPQEEPVTMSALDVFKSSLWGEPLGYEDAPRNAKLVHIPVMPGHTALAVYLEPNARIDALLARGVWSAEPLFGDRHADGAPSSLESGR